MTATPSPGIQGLLPERRSCIDWLSVSRLTSSDKEIRALVDAVQAVVREHVGYGELVPMRTAGNFGEGHRFRRWGAELKFTTRTQAQINDWDEEGRAVGWINFMARGSSGIGSLPLDQAASLIQSLTSLGFDSARRVDCTVDVFDHPDLRIFDIRENLASGRWRIPRRSASVIKWVGPIVEDSGRSQAATLYLGSKDSPSQVVVYDKGVQMELDRPWLRFECRCTGEGAPKALALLQRASEVAFQGGLAHVVLDQAVVGIVRGAADIKDVSAFNDIKNLPKNWIRSPLSVMPPVLAPVFGEVAPLQLAELRLKGGFASRVRHAQRSSGKTIWQLCLLCVAQDRDPGLVALQLGIQSATRMTSDDFEEMSRAHNICPADLEAAEVRLLNLVFERFDLDERILFSDKQQLRAELAVRLGGV